LKCVQVYVNNLHDILEFNKYMY